MKHVAILVLLPVLAAGPVLEGKDKSRPATSREAAFAVETMSAMAKALPAGPLGWRLEGQSAITAPEAVAADALLHPFPLSYSVTWVDGQRQKMAGMDEKRSLASLERAEEERARAEAEIKLDNLIRERDKASQERDLAGVQVLDREIESIATQIRVQKEHAEKVAQKPGMEAIRGIELRVILKVNTFAVPLARATSVNLGLPVAAPAWQEEEGFDGDGLWHEGAMLVFLGEGWQLSGSEPLQVRATEPAGLPSTRAYTLVVRVEGERSRTRAYLQGVDWLGLDALLFK